MQIEAKKQNKICPDSSRTMVSATTETGEERVLATALVVAAVVVVVVAVGHL